MSSINPDELKSPRDLTIPFVTRMQNFAITQVRIDSLIEFGKLIKSFRIENLDTTNNLTWRSQSPSNILRQLAPSAIDEVDEWTSYLEINVNGATGLGQLEIDLVDLQDAKKLLKRKVKEPNLF